MSDVVQDGKSRPGAGLAHSADSPAPVRRVRFRHLRDVRREMTHQYNEHRTGAIGSKKLLARMSALRGIAETFLQGDLEDGLAELYARKGELERLAQAKTAVGSREVVGHA